MRKNVIAKIKKELKNKKEIIDCARKFNLLGDLTKMKICYLLVNYPYLSVSEIAEILDTSISNVSHALRKLKKQNLVKDKKISKICFYSIKDKRLSKLIEVMFQK